MATYNGQKFIEKQILSILSQMKDDDELIIVDDASKDNTVAIIRKIKDKRISIFLNKDNKGVNYSFQRAISLARKPYIFLSDQDDIWVSGRVDRMLAVLSCNPEKLLLTSNCIYIDHQDTVINFINDRVFEKDSELNFKNILSIFRGVENYFGCTMLFRKELVDLILPFPEYIESHDLWIAKMANIMGRNLHLETNTLQRRIHGNNASVVSRGVLPKLWSRVIFLLSIIEIYRRIVKKPL
jgi:glycosyltransferase involved in cell wall biosynthesis